MNSFTPSAQGPSPGSYTFPFLLLLQYSLRLKSQHPTSPVLSLHRRTRISVSKPVVVPRGTCGRLFLKWTSIVPQGLPNSSPLYQCRLEILLTIVTPTTYFTLSSVLWSRLNGPFSVSIRPGSVTSKSFPFPSRQVGVNPTKPWTVSFYLFSSYEGLKNNKVETRSRGSRVYFCR